MEAYLPFAKDDRSRDTALRLRAQLARGERVELPPAPDALGVVAALLELRATEEALIPTPLFDSLLYAYAHPSHNTVSTHCTHNTLRSNCNKLTPL